IYLPELAADQLKDQAAVEAWTQKLREALSKDSTTGSQFLYEVREDEEREQYLPYAIVKMHGLEDEHMFNHEFFSSPVYQAIADFGKKLDGLIEEGAYVQRGERQHPVTSFEEALQWLMQIAQRRQSFQRYKGLGEMNPEQRSETAMDPDSRRLMRVTIEDAIAADQIFNTLMGDEVEPRRDFIQTNALAVTNLDV